MVSYPEFWYISQSLGQAGHMEAARHASIMRVSTNEWNADIYETNPDCQILMYVNMAHIYNTTAAYQDFLNRGWILRDAGGNVITHKSHPAEAVVDLRIVDARQEMARRAAIACEGSDGLFGDYLGKPFGYNKNHYTAWPAAYTDAIMASNMADLINDLEAEGVNLICGNAVPQANGTYGYYRYEEIIKSSECLENLDLQMIEGAYGWDAAEAKLRTMSDFTLNVQLMNELPNALIYVKPMGADPVVDLTPLATSKGGGALYGYCCGALSGLDGRPYHYGGNNGMLSPVTRALMAFDAGMPTGPPVVNADWMFREYQNMACGVNPKTLEGWMQVKEGPEPPPVPPPPTPPPIPPTPPIAIPEGYKLVGNLLLFVGFLELVNSEAKKLDE